MNCAKNAPPQAKLILNLELQSRNTFGLKVLAERAYEITDSEQIPPLMQEIAQNQWKWRVLGGGSNVILPPVLSGATLLMSIAGQKITLSDSENTLLEVGAGVNWHELVQWTLENDLPGLENLALIPGTVGAAPIQNIGAYGVEIGQYIDHVKAYDTTTNQFAMLTHAECKFAYRDSVFKKNPNRFIVTQVIFKLPKAWQARVHYADLAAFASSHSTANSTANFTTNPTPQVIFDAVCAIRSNKLPNPNVIGNAGSFFQNPLVSANHYEALLAKFPQLVSYPNTDNQRKLAAGWLIDQCGFKGQRFGEVGIYEKQALVIVNHGKGTAADILALAKIIQDKVQEQFGVTLEIEPNIL
jgi:UDP-N-acetylmuramate dehydrogenase